MSCDPHSGKSKLTFDALEAERRRPRPSAPCPVACCQLGANSFGPDCLKETSAEWSCVDSFLRDGLCGPKDCSSHILVLVVHHLLTQRFARDQA